MERCRFQMPVLGILTCEILELEIAYLLKNDPSVSHIFVITHPASQGFIKALEENGVDYFTPLESIDDFSPPRDSSLTVLVHVLELGLHSSKSKLQQALSKKNSPMPPGIALRIMSDVCAGLHAAHEARDAEGAPLLLVHRDVSPQNVMISTNGDVKLIDFGIAKALDRVSDETRAGSIKGKIRYMAPEQVRGEPIDRRVDIWAAGVILYQIVTGSFCRIS